MDLQAFAASLCFVNHIQVGLFVQFPSLNSAIDEEKSILILLASSGDERLSKNNLLE